MNNNRYFPKRYVYMTSFIEKMLQEKSLQRICTQPKYPSKKCFDNQLFL